MKIRRNGITPVSGENNCAIRLSLAMVEAGWDFSDYGGKDINKTSMKDSEALFPILTDADKKILYDNKSKPLFDPKKMQLPTGANDLSNHLKGIFLG